MLNKDSLKIYAESTEWANCFADERAILIFIPCDLAIISALNNIWYNNRHVCFFGYGWIILVCSINSASMHILFLIVTACYTYCNRYTFCQLFCDDITDVIG